MGPTFSGVRTLRCLAPRRPVPGPAAAGGGRADRHTVASATFIVHSAHIYERDWDTAEKTLDRWFKRPLPLQTDPSGLFLFGLDEGRARAHADHP